MISPTSGSEAKIQTLTESALDRTTLVSGVIEINGLELEPDVEADVGAADGLESEANVGAVIRNHDTNTSPIIKNAIFLCISYLLVLWLEIILK